MKFKIEEIREKLRSKNEFINFLAQYLILPIFMVVLLFIIIPTIFVINLFLKRKKEIVIENHFKIQFENERIKIKRKFLNEIDYPDDLDYGEVYDSYLHIFESDPNLSIFENRYFDYNFFEIGNGIFLISYNKENEGMSLWFIDKISLEFKKIRNLISSDWDFKNEKNEIILSTKTKKEEIIIKINQMSEI